MSWSNNRESMIQGFQFWVRCRTTSIMLGTQPSNPDLHRDYIASKNPDHGTALYQSELDANQMAVDKLKGEDEDEVLQMTIFPVARFFVCYNGKIYDPETDILPEETDGEFRVLPFIYDYQLRGSFKESISMLTKASGGKSKKGDENKSAVHYASADITAYKKVVDGTWFVTNRKVPLIIPDAYTDDMGNTVRTFDKDGNLPTISRPLRAETAKGPRVALATSEFVPAGTEFYFGIKLLNIKDLKSCLETLDYKQSMGMLQWRGGGKGTLIWTPCNKDGIPYDDMKEEDLSPLDILAIRAINNIIPGACKPIASEDDAPPKCKLVSRTKKTVDDSSTPKKRGRKKKTDADASQTEMKGVYSNEYHVDE